MLVRTILDFISKDSNDPLCNNLPCKIYIKISFPILIFRFNKYLKKNKKHSEMIPDLTVEFGQQPSIDQDY